MNLRNLISNSFATLVLVAGVAGADTIKLESLLERAVERHPLIKSEEALVRIAEARRESLLGFQDWTTSLTAQTSYNESIGIGLPGEIADDRGVYIEAALKRASWSNGSRLEVRARSGFSTVTPRLGSQNLSQYRNEVGMTYSMPLMRNARGILDRLAYDLAEYEIEMTKLTADEKKEDFLLEIGQRYIQWAQYVERIRIIEERRQIAEEELQTAENRFAQNLVEKVDVLRAEDSERIARQSKVLETAEMRGTAIELSVLLDDEALMQSEPEHDLFSLQSPPTEDRIRQAVREETRVIREMNLALEQLQRQEDSLRNAEKPDLDVFVSASVKDGEEEFTSSLGYDQPEVVMGMSWSRPWGSTSAKADLLRSRHETFRLKQRIEVVRRQLESTALSIQQQMIELLEVIELNKAQIESANQLTTEELMMYRQGRGDLNFVLQSRDNEANARLLYTRNAATYQLLNLQLKAVLDQLL